MGCDRRASFCGTTDSQELQGPNDHSGHSKSKGKKSQNPLGGRSLIGRGISLFAVRLSCPALLMNGQYTA